MKIKKFEYETLVRDSEKVALLREIRRRKIWVSDELLDVFCELQSDDASNTLEGLKATRPDVADESAADTEKEARLDIIDKFLNEEQDESFDSTPPPRRTSRQQCG